MENSSIFPEEEGGGLKKGNLSPQRSCDWSEQIDDDLNLKDKRIEGLAWTLNGVRNKSIIVDRFEGFFLPEITQSKYGVEKSSSQIRELDHDTKTEFGHVTLPELHDYAQSTKTKIIMEKPQIKKPSESKGKNFQGFDSQKIGQQ